MIRSIFASNRSRGFQGLAVSAAASIILSGGTAQAADRLDTTSPSTTRTVSISELASRALTRSLSHPVEPGTVRSDRDERAAALPPPSTNGGRSVGRKILGGALGGVAGFFGGGYLGAMIEGDCDCDDPGLRGALIGAPIGAIVGAVLGVKFF